MIMKKNLNRVRVSLLATGAVAIMMLLFSACKKSLDVNNNTPVAALMAFNLAPDKAAIGFALSGSNITNQPLSYTSYTGTYLNIFPGSRQVKSYDFSRPDTSFATVTQNFEVNKFYSAFTLGAKGVYKNIVVNDNFDSLTLASGQAFVRYINAIPDSSKPNVTITSNGSEVSNKSESFASVSDFKGINPGDIIIKVSNGTTISATRTISLEKGKVYTILLVGIPASTDTDKLVQIKYITNGTVS